MKNDRRAKMIEVAEYAGVSAAVVSRVLNNDETLSIREDTRKRVLDAVKVLSYTPNPHARSLKTERSYMVGLMVVDIANPFAGQLIRGVQSVLNDMGITCFLSESQDDSKKEQELLEEMYNRQVDGVILATLKLDDPILPLVKSLGLKCVAATRTVPDIEYPSIMFDHEKSIRISLDYLMSLGHTKIGYIMGHMRSFSGQMRMKIYKEIMEENGLLINDGYLVQSNYFAEGGYDAMWQLMKLPDPPTAVIACNDVVAINAIRAAHTLGVSVPGDVSIIGYNNIGFSSMVYPALTTIDTPSFEIGKRAAKMMVASIEGRPIHPKNVIVDTHLVIRDSTAPCTRKQ